MSVHRMTAPGAGTAQDLVRASLRGFRRAWQRRALRRRSSGSVHGLSNEMLRDIGLSRTDLQLAEMGLPHRARLNRDH